MSNLDATAYCNEHKCDIAFCAPFHNQQEPVRVVPRITQHDVDMAGVLKERGSRYGDSSTWSC